MKDTTITRPRYKVVTIQNNMKKTVIYEVENEDRNYYVFYNENGQCQGVNFHHGCVLDTETIDDTYLKPCPDMSPIYFNHLGDVCAAGELITDKHIMKALQDSARQYLVSFNQFEREHIIEQEIDINMEVLFERVADRCYSKSGDISPAQNAVLEDAKMMLRVLLTDYTNRNAPKRKEDEA